MYSLKGIFSFPFWYTATAAALNQTPGKSLNTCKSHFFQGHLQTRFFRCYRIRHILITVQLNRAEQSTLSAGRTSLYSVSA